MKIAVVNVKGGVGKSTSAVYLAAVAAERGDRTVVVVDADSQATAAVWLEERPVDGVTVVEAPSERMIGRAAELGGDAVVVIDTPPHSERLTGTALEVADVALIPTKVGGLEVDRVHALLRMVPPKMPHGLVITHAEIGTNDYADTLNGWREAGVPVWGSVPKRVGIAAGPDRPLHPHGIVAYRDILARAMGAHHVDA